MPKTISKPILPITTKYDAKWEKTKKRWLSLCQSK